MGSLTHRPPGLHNYPWVVSLIDLQTTGLSMGSLTLVYVSVTMLRVN